MTFDEMWGKSRRIVGAFYDKEAKVLYDQAMAQGPCSVFVEIGSYLGRSSSLLGQIAIESNSHLTCIDDFIDFAPNITNRGGMIKQFKRNMWKTNAKYELMAMKSEEAAKKFNKEIDLLFIDGDHRYIGVKKDCELWLPKLKPEGCVVFHDYKSSWEGVKKAVDEFTDDYLLVGPAQTLIAKLKPFLEESSWRKTLSVMETISDHYSMTKEQQHLVYKHALKVPKGGTVVELGVAHGRTAALFIHLAKYKGFHYHGVDDFSLTNNSEKVLTNLKRVGTQFTLYTQKTQDVDWTTPIDLLIIDAGHDPDNVIADCEKWIPYIIPGGVVMLHDYDEKDDPGHEGAHWAIKHYGDIHTGDWEDLDFYGGLKIRRRLGGAKSLT